MIETHPFEFFIPENPKYLLLGSFPSIGYLEDSNYDWFYSGKRSQFWPILEQVYNLELKQKSQKQALFNNLGIAISDIIYQCVRVNNNSLDANLKVIIYNLEITKVLKDNNIRKIFFTGRFVEHNFRKHFKEYLNYELVTLPSPSPRYASITKVQKISIYKSLLPTL